MSGFIGPKPSDVPVGTIGTGTISANSIVVGSNVSLTTTTLSVGNSTVNTFANSSTLYMSGNAISPYTGMRNRIINGAMTIDQRNAGASLSISTDPNPRNHPVDRFFTSASGGGVYTAQRSTTAPTGFTNSLALTVTTADSSIAAGDVYYMAQGIEGVNVYDFGFGASGASTITLSFWVRSSIAGTYSGSLRNGASNRAYSFNYTISSINTWEQKTITITGDTTGTWATDNTTGMWVAWDLGSGTNFNGTANAWSGGNYLRTSSGTNWIATLGATWYITGVQIEAGSSATPFERRLYSLELSLCHRYYYYTASPMYGYNGSGAALTCSAHHFWPVPMRSSPTVAVGTGAILVSNITGAVTYQSNIASGASYNPATISASAEI